MALRGLSQMNRPLVNTFKYAKQSQLYIHEISAEKTLVSFSENPDKAPIGSLTAPIGSGGIITPANFREYKPFYEILHKTYAKYAHLDQTYILDALNYPGSFMALADYKVVLDYMNQRPEMANTIGFIHVNFDCEMEPTSYEKNDMYNLCNIDGIITLSEFMQEKLEL